MGRDSATDFIPKVRQRHTAGDIVTKLDMCLTLYLPLKIWAMHQELQHHLATLQNGSFPDALIQTLRFNKVPGGSSAPWRVEAPVSVVGVRRKCFYGVFFLIMSLLMIYFTQYFSDMAHIYSKKPTQAFFWFTHPRPFRDRYLKQKFLNLLESCTLLRTC